jgi:thioredoxin 1
MRQTSCAILLLLVVLLAASCGSRNSTPQTGSKAETGATAKITFLELGSVTCIPCKQMKPVMESIEKRYAGQVKVVFYDVWKDKRPAEQYKIRLIPTQVFLDKSGNELMRHEGFFAEAEIDKFLASQGVKPNG